MNESPFATPLDELSLQRLRKRCRATQERVYRTYVDACWNLALRSTGCEARAWDVVQDAFVRAFRKPAQLRDPSRFGFWLRRIVVHGIADQYRDRFEASRVDSDEEPVEAAGEPTWLDLERCLGRLGSVDRLVLWLHDAEGMTHEEIAESTGHTVPWSKTRLSRARARLRKMLNAGLPASRDGTGEALHGT
ncbi:MAG: sigma-70 family RNA polymerase sigma factor [Wenzhouxiangellaceae bacterium]|nr:sigma-70 family RNA polymerase sigma factor [Wenzhouxiangellaceae bacterium]